MEKLSETSFLAKKKEVDLEDSKKIETEELVHDQVAELQVPTEFKFSLLK